jgi:hypothetical protein
MSLDDWQKFGWLKAHKTNRNEIAELLAVADRDLGASKTPGLHNDWGFNIACNAALQIATAALAASGYQAERANHHYCVIDSLSLALGTDAGSIKKFDIFRKKTQHIGLRTSRYHLRVRQGKGAVAGRKASGGLRRWIQKNLPQLKPYFALW